MFSMVAPAYANKYGVDEDELQQVLARIAWKNHYNGARNPRAQFRREMSIETICASPRLAGHLGVFDCAGVADGAAAAIVVRAEDAHQYTDKPLYVKALSLVAGNGVGLDRPRLRLHALPRDRRRGDRRLRSRPASPIREPSSPWPRCTTASRRPSSSSWRTSGSPSAGTAWKECLAGTFDLDGELPVNPDGGLKSFGHPVGASGLRMTFEAWLQLRGEAPEERRIASLEQNDRKPLALTHNLGGYPGEMVGFVSILGTEAG